MFSGTNSLPQITSIPYPKPSKSITFFKAGPILAVTIQQNSKTFNATVVKDIMLKLEKFKILVGTFSRVSKDNFLDMMMEKLKNYLKLVYALVLYFFPQLPFFSLRDIENKLFSEQVKF